MKNFLIYCSVFFFGFSNLVNANTNKISRDAITYANDCNEASLPVKLRDMKYVGTHLVELNPDIGNTCIVVKYADMSSSKSMSDAIARKHCVAKVGAKSFVFNPGNDQYTGSSSYGDRSKNSLGYYFCTATRSNEKELLCKKQKEAYKDVMDVEWDSDRGDGDCKCSPKGSGGKLSKQAHSCSANNPVEPNRSIENKCKDPNLVYNEADKLCYCAEPEFTKQVTNDSKSCVRASNPDIKPSYQEIVDSCTQDIRTAYDECAAVAKNAYKSCNNCYAPDGSVKTDQCADQIKSDNKLNDDMAKAIQLASNFVVQAKRGTGAVAACTQAQLIGSTAMFGLDSLKKSCRSDIDSCVKACTSLEKKSSKFEQIQVRCDEAYKEKFATEPTEEFKTAVDNKLNVYVELAEKANSQCRGPVTAKERQMTDYLDGLSQSVGQANLCRCTLSSGNSTNCERNSNPALVCLNSPNTQECKDVTVNCATTNNPICICASNPSNPICSQAPAAAVAGVGTSNLGGPNGFASVGTGGGSAQGSGGGSGGNFDLGNLGDTQQKVSGTGASGGSDSPFGGGASAGGGAGGSSGGGSGPSGVDSNVGQGEGTDKDKVSSFFSTAKSAIGNLFGTPTADQANKAKKNQKAFGADSNAYKPKANLRGLSNESEIGGKNKDIWKMVNERYGNQFNSFITEQ